MIILQFLHTTSWSQHWHFHPEENITIQLNVMKESWEQYQYQSKECICRWSLFLFCYNSWLVHFLGSCGTSQSIHIPLACNPAITSQGNLIQIRILQISTNICFNSRAKNIGEQDIYIFWLPSNKTLIDRESLETNRLTRLPQQPAKLSFWNMTSVCFKAK